MPRGLQASSHLPLPPRPTHPSAPLGALQLARLLALSHGETVLTRERWGSMKGLEARRRERLQA